MKILKQHSHKQGYEILNREHPDLLDEVENAIGNLNAVSCLTKISKETSKVRRWGGLLFSPPTMNDFFRVHLLEPKGWLTWDQTQKRYIEPILLFPDELGLSTNDRFRKMDGLKDRVGLEFQFGKYAFMGYDIFSKMIIFKNLGLIDYGIEIVAVQEMVHCMSTGVSAFEALMVDFENRGEADIDIPVTVWGIGPTEAEWQEVAEVQKMFRQDPEGTKQRYPMIGQRDWKGSIPGPK